MSLTCSVHSAYSMACNAMPRAPFGRAAGQRAIRRDIMCSGAGGDGSVCTIRRARPEDYEGVARVCTAVFTNETSSRMLAEVPDSPLLDTVLRLEADVAKKAMVDLKDRVSKLSERKLNARAAQRLLELDMENMLLSARIAQMKGEQQKADELQEDYTELAKMHRRRVLQWRYQRESMVLVATLREDAQERPDTAGATNHQNGASSPAQEGQASADEQGASAMAPAEGSQAGASTEIQGCCVVTLKVLGALLPAPFPSKLPARLYVGNLAVQQSQQRRGIATQLLKAIERLARRWRHRQVWLHVHQSNNAAVQLYRSAGYEVISTDREWRPPFKSRFLMCKTLTLRPPLAKPTSFQGVVETPAPEPNAMPVLPAGGPGDGAPGTKIFVWDSKADDV